MKVLCEREKLREALNVVCSVIPTKSTRPAVENVYLVATDDCLELVGTDLDVAVRYRIEEVKVEEAGTALIPARVASDFVRDLSGEIITMETVGTNFTISSGEDNCDLSTIDVDEYPVVSTFTDENTVSLLGATFSRLVARTGFAAAREAGRYAMHGILVQVEDEKLSMVATDGRRLAMTSAALEDSGPKNLRAIVPTKGMQLISRVIHDPMELIKIQFGESQFCMKTSKAEVFARMIDGEFPRYQAVIPASTENTMDAQRDHLSQKLKLVANVTSADTRSVRLSMDKSELTIFGRAAATGEATAHLDVDYQGAASTIAFNPDYLIDGLKNCELDTVRLEFNEKNSPGKFTLGEDYIYIVMPITVDA
jgi:DNA polymerase-3 subunit beta